MPQGSGSLTTKSCSGRGGQEESRDCVGSFEEREKRKRKTGQTGKRKSKGKRRDRPAERGGQDALAGTLGATPTWHPTLPHTPAAWGVPTASERGQNQRCPTSAQGGYRTLAASGGPHRLRAGAESQVAQNWAMWLHNPCRLGGPLRFSARGRIRSGPQVGKVAT